MTDVTPIEMHKPKIITRKIHHQLIDLNGKLSLITIELQRQHTNFLMYVPSHNKLGYLLSGLEGKVWSSEDTLKGICLEMIVENCTCKHKTLIQLVKYEEWQTLIQTLLFTNTANDHNLIWALSDALLLL